MKVIKQVLRSDTVRTGLCWLGAQYIRLVYLTSRWTVLNSESPGRFWKENKPFILCLWHGRMLMFPCAWHRRKPIYMLASSHRDGQIISKTVGHLGIHTITGSTTRGGTQAVREMLGKLKDDQCIGITPDGPGGPRMRASDGVVALARLSGVPVIPASCNTRRRRILSSWDRFLVAWPFNRGVFVWGEPIYVDRRANKAERERCRVRIENTLNDLTHQADRYFAHPEIQPENVELSREST